MKILEIKSIEGANIYCHRSVIRLKLHLGEYDGILTCDIKGFNNELLCRVPSLNEHYCSLGKPGGFVERLKKGTYLGHVVEHVALEMQHLAGMNVVYGKTVRADLPGLYYIVTEYESKKGGLQALKSAVGFVHSLLRNVDTDFRKEVARVEQAAACDRLGPSTDAIAKEALKRRIPVMRLGEGSILQLGYGRYRQIMEATITGRTRCVGVDIACDKALVKQLLAEAGIPVPQGGVAGTEKEALEIADRIGEAVAVKPFDGNQGKGVALNLKTPQEITRAFDMAKTVSPKVIVEKYIQGRHYRLLVVGDRVVAASERIPALVTGDGQKTIRQLVQKVNRDPLRGESHEKPLTRIKIDPIVLTVLAKQGLTPESVPGQGEVVYLRENANISTGGTAIDITGRVHPESVELALRAVRLVGLDVAGIDLVAGKIEKPLLPDNGAIIEINAAPGIRMHHYPSQGESRNVAGAILDMLFPPGSESRIPIVSVTGTNGKTTVTRMISHILQSSGVVVGTTTSDGIYLNGKKIVCGDTTGPRSARVVLRDPSVQAAVLETARGGILRSGLGYDYSDVGIITNISNDHLGQDGIETLEDMTYVKAVVAEAVHRKGTTVLNADDVNVVPLAERVKSGIIYFSMASDNLIVRRHLGAGGMAVFVKNGSIVMARGTMTHKVLPVKQIPCCLEGRAHHNIQNSLAAVAGVMALKADIELIREGMLSFTPDENCNPGRLNIFDMGKFRTVVDYGHNEAGYINTLQTVKRLKPKRVIGVVGMPGDRQDQDIIRVAGIAAKYCDEIIIKEDSDTRGRAAGEVAGIIRQAVLEKGFRDKRVHTVLDEAAAVKSGLDRACEGDIVVIFYEKIEPVMKLVRSARWKQVAGGVESEDQQKVVCRKVACSQTG